MSIPQTEPTKPPGVVRLLNEGRIATSRPGTVALAAMLFLFALFTSPLFWSRVNGLNLVYFDVFPPTSSFSDVVDLMAFLGAFWTVAPVVLLIVVPLLIGLWRSERWAWWVVLLLAGCLLAAVADAISRREFSGPLALDQSVALVLNAASAAAACVIIGSLLLPVTWRHYWEAARLRAANASQAKDRGAINPASHAPSANP